MHVGSDPLHRPFAWHVRLRLPIRINPKLQLYSATDPNSVLAVSVTDPSTGSLNSPQSTAAIIIGLKFELDVHILLWYRCLTSAQYALLHLSSPS